MLTDTSDATLTHTCTQTHMVHVHTPCPPQCPGPRHLLRSGKVKGAVARGGMTGASPGRASGGLQGGHDDGRPSLPGPSEPEGRLEAVCRGPGQNLWASGCQWASCRAARTGTTFPSA